MSERSAYIINHNFELIFGRLNHDVIPTMGSVRKFIAKQKHINKTNSMLVMVFAVYICLNEERQLKQEKELQKLKKEIRELKGE